jgi:ABC-type sugar transport system ATPase subunit
MHSPPPARLSLSNITKRYPGVVANRSVSLTVQAGEAHAVLGENGAGKSTLMKIIYGSVKPDEGDIHYNGQVVHIRNPQQARALGISMVFQHFSLFDTLSVAENVWLGLDKSFKLAEVTERLRHLLSDMDPEATYWLQHHYALLAKAYRQAFPAILEAVTAFEFDLAIERLDAALSARALLVREILTIDTANG